MELLRRRRNDVRFVQMRRQEAAACACGHVKFTGKIGVRIVMSGSPQKQTGGGHEEQGHIAAALDQECRPRRRTDGGLVHVDQHSGNAFELGLGDLDRTLLSANGHAPNSRVKASRQRSYTSGYDRPKRGMIELIVP
jgi:hypothetical protein